MAASTVRYGRRGLHSVWFVSVIGNGCGVVISNHLWNTLLPFLSRNHLLAFSRRRRACDPLLPTMVAAVLTVLCWSLIEPELQTFVSAQSFSRAFGNDNPITAREHPFQRQLSEEGEEGEAAPGCPVCNCPPMAPLPAPPPNPPSEPPAPPFPPSAPPLPPPAVNFAVRWTVYGIIGAAVFVPMSLVWCFIAGPCRS